jgi:hypothetical protein
MKGRGVEVLEYRSVGILEYWSLAVLGQLSNSLQNG